MSHTPYENMDDSALLAPEAVAPRKRGLLARFLLFIGSSVAIVALFGLVVSPVVLGYIWFFHDLDWSLNFFDLSKNHPPHYYKILQSCAIGCFLYSVYLAWKIFKFIRSKAFLILVLFFGSFVCTSFLASALYDHGYFG